MVLHALVASTVLDHVSQKLVQLLVQGQGRTPINVFITFSDSLPGWITKMVNDLILEILERQKIQPSSHAE